MTEGEAAQFNNFLEHPNKKVILITGNDETIALKAIKQQLEIQGKSFVEVDLVNQHIANLTTTHSPAAAMIITLTINCALTNIFMKYPLDKWQEKLIVICRNSMLHATCDASIYFAPFKADRLQKQLFMRLTLSSKATGSKRNASFSSENQVVKNASMLANAMYDLLNNMLMTNDRLVMQMLADRILLDENFKALLFKTVFASRKNVQMAVAAANAITALKTARISFAGLDLSDIKVPHADLSGGNFHFTNFTGACLENVNLSDTFLVDSYMYQTNLRGANFGEHPGLLYNNSIRGLALSKDMTNFVMIDIEGMLSIIDIANKKTILEIKALKDGEAVIYIGYDSNNNVIVVDKEGSIGIWFWLKTKENTNNGEKYFHVITDANINWLDVHWQSIKRAIHSIIQTIQITFEAFAYATHYFAIAHREENVYVTTISFYDLDYDNCPSLLTINSISDNNFMSKYQNNSVCCLALIEQKQLLCAIYEGGGIAFWNLNTKQMQPPLIRDFHTAKIAYSPQHNYYAIAQNRYRSQQPIIEITEGNEIELATINVLKGHKYGIDSIGFIDRDNLLITSGNDATVRFWDFIHYQNKNESHSSTLYALDVNLEKNIVATGDFSGKVIIWNLTYGIIIKTLTIARNIHTLKFIENDSTLYLFVGCDGYGLLVWDYITDERFLLSGPAIYDVKQFQNLGIGVGYEIVIFTMLCRQFLSAKLSERIWCFSIDNESNTLFLGSFKGNILRYKADLSHINFHDKTLTQHIKQTDSIKAHSGLITGLVSTEDKLISSGEDGKIIIWRKMDMQRLTHLDLTYSIWSIAFHSTRNILALGVQRNIFIFDVTTLECIELIPAHKCEKVNRLLFCSDNTLASCGDDQTLNIWKASTINNPLINADSQQIPNYLKSPFFSKLYSNRKQYKINVWLLHWSSSQQFWCKGCKFDETKLTANNQLLLEQRTGIFK